MSEAIIKSGIKEIDDPSDEGQFSMKPSDNSQIESKLILKNQKIAITKIKSYKASALKKKAVKFNLKAKESGKGKLTYKVKSTPKGMKKFITVSKKGVVTIEKNDKKGSYKITITAAAKGNFKKATKTITIKVK